MSWRNQHNVLVPQADASGMVAVIRSLGRSGYRVHACAAEPSAIGLGSRFAYRSVVHPPYHAPEFLPWIKDYVASNEIHAIVPSEGFLVAVQESYDEFRAMFPDAPDRSTMYRCLSKADVFGALLSAPPGNAAANALPPSFVVSRDSVAELEAWLSANPPPYFVKLDACLANSDDDGGVIRCRAGSEVIDMAADLLDRFDRFLVQGAVAGCKATVNLFISRGRVLAETMCVAMHENPHTGGLTTYRRTWWNQQMREDAEHKLRLLGWEGVAMVEYKWDARDNTYHFIELNARYWAALHLDLFAGSDIPRLQLDHHFGVRDEALPRQALGVRCRYTVPADFGYALSRIRDPGVPISGRVGTAIGFVALCFDPLLHTDLYFPGDRMLYWRQWRRFFRDLFRSVLRRVGLGKGSRD